MCVDPPEGQSVQGSSGTLMSLVLCRLGQWVKHFKEERLRSEKITLVQLHGISIYFRHKPELCLHHFIFSVL